MLTWAAVDGIGRVTADGDYEHWPLPAGTDPQTIVQGPNGARWFTTESQVGRLTPAGKLTMWPAPGARSLGSTVAADGAFWLADETTSVVRDFSPPDDV
ncbi:MULTISPECIES: hypothetical protein [unclassified Streptomyces]|uniref:virginiamycin B lyase family protein n=1 Tax=unclassified Streptomyces TaxID=2593676 RepID=UPI0033ABE62C